MKKRGEMDRALEVTQKQLYRAVSKTLERLTLLMDVQTDARDALRTAQIYRQAEAIFSVGRRHELRADDAAVSETRRHGKGAGLPETNGGSRRRPGDDAESGVVLPDACAEEIGEQTPRELRVMLSRGLREDEAFTDLRDTQAYREAAARLEESLQKEN